tara:strand:- start:15485 stop:17392 length:1908 start_codon:yes stop_codon:yes gene_type:complete
MQKIRLTEEQILMLQKLGEGNSKSKVLKINEDQYNRLFKSAFNTNNKVSKGIDKAGLNEEPKKEVDLSKFAQELIVFIKDMLSRPEKAPYSDYWLELGLPKDKLIKMLEDEGLLALSLDETDGVNKYVSEKHGFRRKVKDCYNKVNEMDDAGYPAGAENDPNNPLNQEDPEPESEKVLGIKAAKEILKLIYYNEDLDGLCVFKNKNGVIFAITLESLVTFKGEKLKPYLNSDQTLETANGDTAKHFINDKLDNQQIKAFSENAPEGELALINPKVKNDLIKWYGEDKTLVSILNNIEETTGAASSGAYVGGASMGPIKKDTGNSPEEAMGELITDNRFGQEAVVAYDGKYSDEQPFKAKGEWWIYCWGDYNGKRDIAVYRPSTDMAYDYNWFRKTILGINEGDLDETTSTVSAGGDSGTFAYDAPAGDGSAFWNAGNKENKHEGDMPIVKRPIAKVVEGEDESTKDTYHRALSQYKLAKQNGGDVAAAKSRYVAAAKNIGITVNEGKRVLKITEAQLKRIIESNNQTSTAYPNGEMVDLDDCTKLNNNKVAQNGGCSQGAVDNVVKTRKTKGSVVAEMSSIQSKLVPLLVQAIEQVDGSLNYGEFADAVGTIIKEQYGTHLIKPFMQKLHNNLGI